ncbi:hypothetical protein ACMZOO_09075 [Catenovulum sp. SX2]|uniref:hypothetical protein n=1 Tax=Catenovulum sp. SX2 TaxID=3398614 RepID=UPI003F851400
MQERTLRITSKKSCLIYACFFLLLSPFKLLALDQVMAYSPEQNFDKREEYHLALLKAVLVETEQELGPFELTRTEVTMPRSRQAIELTKGNIINVIASPPLKGQLSNSLRVPFPIRRGLSSYRIFLVMHNNVDLYKNANTLDAVKQFKTGQKQYWSTERILRHHGFNVVSTANYKGLFKMLALGRFDSLNRDIAEAYIELETFKKEIPQLSYDRHIALYTYLPYYFYVSPKQQNLAKRLEFGLLKLHKSGQLDTLLFNYFGPYLHQAKLGNRRIFHIENINLANDMYSHDQAYLLDLTKSQQSIEQAAGF